jgi:predicted DNA-binding protein (UPF0251 family)
MKISRGTVQRLLERGRRTLLEAILSNSAVAIAEDTITHSERVKQASDL